MNIETTRENLIIHIEGLQATLAKRNQRIAELESQLNNFGKSRVVEKAEKRAYKRGWEDCSNLLANSAHEMARALYKIRQSAFKVALEGEKNND